jgi:spermidine synthase
MAKKKLDSTIDSVPATRRFLPALLLLFVGSGCAALIYEIVWFQLLQLVVGSSAVSLGVLLGTFMGGMCLGSLLLSRVVSAREHPLRVYAMLEIGIGVLGIIVLFLVPLVGRAYASIGGHGPVSILLRGVVGAICLLPPTLLMGATLPAIARWVETTPKGVSWLGFFYGGNIAGAVFGCLLAGFYLLRVHDMVTATLVAAAINFVVAGVGLWLSKTTPHVVQETVIVTDTPAKGEVTVRPVRAPGSVLVYVAIALSGATALASEVVWTRLLSLMLGATVYTFSIILAVFLTGLGIGSSVGSYLARTLARPRIALGVCQMLLVAGIAWAAFMLADVLPNWPINPSLSTSPWITFHLDLTRSFWAILPAATLWGASFPLALASVAARGQDPGRLVGEVYAANTVGAIVGALAASLVMVGSLGTQGAQRLVIGLCVISAMLMFVPLIVARRSESDAETARADAGIGVGSAMAVVAAVVIAVLLLRGVPKVPPGLVAYGRFLPTWTNQPSYLYVGEGMNSSVAVSDWGNGVRNFHVSGKIEASTEPQDMRLQRLLGNLPALVHPNPKSVLIVGFGAGVTAGTFVLYPGIERIVICEIEPLIPKVVAEYFGPQNYDVVRDPRVEIVYDDARHYILTTGEKFDIITSDPIHPWVKGAATLYTKEYFELVKEHLNPGGVVTQWVPLYESNTDVVKSEVATFVNAFPNATVWGNTNQGQGYDTVLLGQADATRIDVDALQMRLAKPEYARAAQSLGEVGFTSVIDLLGTYAGRGPELAPWLVGAQLNRDRNLRLQFLAGMGNNMYQGGPIYSEMLSYRKYPEQLFTTSGESGMMLREAIGGQR